MKLNLACGPDVRPGYVNVDIAPMPGVEAMDLFAFPWKLPDGAFDEVVCNHFIEHIPHHMGTGKDGFFLFFEELHRVTKPGAVVKLRTPSPGSPNNRADPTHTRVIVPENFRFLEPDNPSNYYTTARFKLVGWRRVWCPPHSIGYHLQRYLKLRLNVMPYEREYVLERV